MSSTSIYIKTTLLQQIKDRAKAQHRSVSYVICALLTTALKAGK